jgi:5-methylcytosine-specific restriction endonuclease McrA
MKGEKSMDHVNDDCKCDGKMCTKCKGVQCVGKYTKDKRLKCGLKSQCRVCQNMQGKGWREKNREHDTERHKKWKEENKERIRETTHQRYIDNRERYSAYAHRHYLENIEQSRSRGLQYYYENREKQLQVKRQRRQNEAVKIKEQLAWKTYYKENRDHLIRQSTLWGIENRRGRAAIQAVRRTRKTLAGGSHTPQEWLDLCIKYDYRCLSCGRQSPDIELTADHITPVSKGGTSNIDNIQPLCRSCNCSKHDKTIDFRP